MYHEFVNSKNYAKLHSPFCRAVLSLKDIPFKILSNWWAIQSNDYFERMVEAFKNVVLHIITIEMKKDRITSAAQLASCEANLELALKTLGKLNKINDKTRTSRISYETFYLPELLDYLNLQADYVTWITGKVSSCKVGTFWKSIFLF